MPNNHVLLKRIPEMNDVQRKWLESYGIREGYYDPENDEFVVLQRN